MAIYSKSSFKCLNNCVHKMHKFWFLGRFVFASITLVTGLQEVYIV
jgi:hypothetical protein